MFVTCLINEINYFYSFFKLNALFTPEITENAFHQAANGDIFYNSFSLRLFTSGITVLFPNITIISVKYRL